MMKTDRDPTVTARVSQMLTSDKTVVTFASSQHHHSIWSQLHDRFFSESLRESTCKLMSTSANHLDRVDSDDESGVLCLTLYVITSLSTGCFCDE